MAEKNPFILLSEHKRVLASAQARYDEELKLRERIGFWRGLGTAAWIGGALTFAALLIGVQFGLGFAQ